MNEIKYTDEYIEFIKLLNKHKVDYLIIGAYATMLYTKIPRATKDFDTWVRQTENNLKKLNSVFEEFVGTKFSIDYLKKKGQKIEIKNETNTVLIEIWTSQHPLDFDEAWEKRETDNLNGIPLYIISKEHLIMLKKYHNRTQDKLDLENLSKEKSI